MEQPKVPNPAVTTWRPHEGPQELALAIPDNTFEILYGGARGGGKTDAGLAWIGEPMDNARYRGLVIRKNADDLSDWLDRVARFYPDAKVVGKPAVMRFKSGALVRTGHIKDDQAYTKYQGQEYHRILIEELTQIPELKRYLQLISSARSTVPGLKAQVFATTNPGGVGHMWVKQRWRIPDDVSTITTADVQPSTRFKDAKSGRLRIFIPSTIDDNPTLLENDPDYVGTLEGIAESDPDLYQAWRHGNWGIFAGQAFREWNPAIHVVTKMEWSLAVCRRYMSYDWGFRDPGVCTWIAITPENAKGVQRAYVYRELTMTGKNPREWAASLKIIAKVDGARDIYLPHDCFNKENGDSIADIFMREGGLKVFAATTMAPGARLNRKALLHAGLQMAPDDKPYLQIHANCKGLIETIPALVYDDNKPEDIDTDGPDHWYDAVTCGLLMEAPRFGLSGSVDPRKRMKGFQSTWTPDEQGELHGPDFVAQFKDKQANPPKPRIW